MRFPLDQRAIGGYIFGQKAWYSLPYSAHLGVDYKASYVNLYAPCEGDIIYQGYGLQGGNTIHLKIVRDGVTYIVRFMHLKRFIRGLGHVAEGELIGVTGNSGVLTTGAHLHIDISVGSIVLPTLLKPFPTNFIDPEKFNWSNDAPAPAPVPTPQAPEAPHTEAPAPTPAPQPSRVLRSCCR